MKFYLAKPVDFRPDRVTLSELARHAPLHDGEVLVVLVCWHNS